MRSTIDTIPSKITITGKNYFFKRHLKRMEVVLSTQQMKKRWFKNIYELSWLTEGLWHLKNLLPPFTPLSSSACCKLYPNQVQLRTQGSLSPLTISHPSSSSMCQKLYPRKQWFRIWGLYITVHNCETEVLPQARQAENTSVLITLTQTCSFNKESPRRQLEER